jgi:hypothetical protein
MRAAWVDPTPTVLIFSSIYGGGDASPGFPAGRQTCIQSSGQRRLGGTSIDPDSQAGLCNHYTIRVGRSFSFVPRVHGITCCNIGLSFTSG